jgi:hypothetical protein
MYIHVLEYDMTLSGDVSDLRSILDTYGMFMYIYVYISMCTFTTMTMMYIEKVMQTIFCTKHPKRRKYNGPN